MKTVKERLEELFYEYSINDTREMTLQTKQVRELVSHSFEQGVNFTQRWIPVEEELPKNAIETGNVILLNGNSYVGFGFFDKNMDFHCIGLGRDSLIGHSNIKFTHWLPIDIAENND